MLALSACSTEVKTEYSRMDGHFYEDSIVLDSDWIIVGDIIKVNKPEKLYIGTNNTVSEREKEAHSYLYTVSEVKVIEVIKGSNVNVGDIIKVKQMGDEKSEPDYHAIEGVGYLREGTQNILFIREFSKLGDFPCDLTNSSQSVIEIKENKVIPSKNDLFKNDATKDDLIKTIKYKVLNPVKIPVETNADTPIATLPVIK